MAKAKENTTELALNEQKEATKALPKNEAIGILKGLQKTASITVPVVFDGKLLHEGIKFEVGALEYNTFVNETQTGKTSQSALAKNFLVRCVAEEDQDFLTECLKITGQLDFFMSKVLDGAVPKIHDSLD